MVKAEAVQNSIPVLGLSPYSGIFCLQPFGAQDFALKTWPKLMIPLDQGEGVPTSTLLKKTGPRDARIAPHQLYFDQKFTTHPLEKKPSIAQARRRCILNRDLRRPSTIANVNTSAKTTGLRYWMFRVLDECDKVAADFSADPVHDLRVALRRCRSMADGLMAMDPDPEWKSMKKAGKQLFQSLGNLRDVQIMMEWTEKLSPLAAHTQEDHPQRLNPPKIDADPAADQPNETPAANDDHDSVARALLDVLAAREHEHKREAQSALDAFDRKQWRHWSKSLPARAARFRLGSTLFKHLALERWTEARTLHKRALRNRSQAAWHQLRIGIKRFRYIVENFLPEEHKAWSDDLKRVQDLLGEVHDLDVLWATALSSHVFRDELSRRRWHALIIQEKEKRITEYREKMTGPHNLWDVWRNALPAENTLQAIALRRMKLWAKGLDPDFAHSEHVSALALELYDGLKSAALLKPANGAGEGRSTLQLAALLHDVGKAKKKKKHQKSSFKLIQAHGAPLGWNAADIKRAAVVARFHCGALPTKNHKTLRDLLPNEQKTAIELAAILRLANAFDAQHDGRVRRVRIGNPDRQSAAAWSRNGRRYINGLPRKLATPAAHEAVLIAAEGYGPNIPAAQTIAAERHLLETVLHRPVMVVPMQSSKIGKARGTKSRAPK